MNLRHHPHLAVLTVAVALLMLVFKPAIALIGYHLLHSSENSINGRYIRVPYRWIILKSTNSATIVKIHFTIFDASPQSAITIDPLIVNDSNMTSGDWEAESEKALARRGFVKTGIRQVKTIAQSISCTESARSTHSPDVFASCFDPNARLLFAFEGKEQDRFVLYKMLSQF